MLYPPAIDPPPISPQRMSYRIRRIRLASAFKVGLLLGGCLALGPALALAWLGQAVLHRVDGALGQIKTMDITVLGQNLATIDPIGLVGQTDNVQHVHALAADATGTFWAAALVLAAGGALLVWAGILLFCGGYNVLAHLTGGLEVELDPVARNDNRTRTRSA